MLPKGRRGGHARFAADRVPLLAHIAEDPEVYLVADPADLFQRIRAGAAVAAARRRAATAAAAAAALVDAFSVAAARGVDDVDQAVRVAQVVQKGVALPSAQVCTRHEASYVLHQQRQSPAAARRPTVFGLDFVPQAERLCRTRSREPARTDVGVDRREGVRGHGSLSVGLLGPRGGVEEGGLPSRRLAHEADDELPRLVVVACAESPRPSSATAIIGQQLRRLFLSLLDQSLVHWVLSVSLPPRVRWRVVVVAILVAVGASCSREDTAGSCTCCDVSLVVLDPLLRSLEHDDHAREAQRSSFLLSRRQYILLVRQDAHILGVQLATKRTRLRVARSEGEAKCGARAAGETHREPHRPARRDAGHVVRELLGGVKRLQCLQFFTLLHADAWILLPLGGHNREAALERPVTREDLVPHLLQEARKLTDVFRTLRHAVTSVVL
mmetsp:Transcript_140409/g.350016  ORF Transcript_140409/g.350016 Transcript_140409/m.350016 type:complete len:441 (+) Transcript_140409:834-2156(+)